MEIRIPDWLRHPDPEVYRSDNYVVLDFETTNLEKGSALNEDNRIVLACWWDNATQTMHKQWGGELDMAELVAACSKADFIVGHNIAFEIQWLERCGYDIGSRPVFCTMVAEWVLAGNRPWGLMNSASLDACMARRCMPQKSHLVSHLIKSGVCPSDIPQGLLLKYCLKDVRLTRLLMQMQIEETEDTRLLPVMYTRMLATPVLADIETYGLHLDKDRVEETYERYMEEYIRVKAELDTLTGGINTNSNPQVAHFVYGELGFEEKKDRRGQPLRNKPSKQFPDGVPKVSDEVLTSLRATTKPQKEFIRLKKEIAKLSSAISKNLSMFVGAVREQDAIVYIKLNQCTTMTHRLSSSGRRTYFKMFDDWKGCQGQNLPRRFKRLFSARHDGWNMIEIDYAQLEFGVAGHLGRDATIRHEVRTGYDVHTYTRDVINATDKKQIDRTGAKRHTFKPLYGGQKGTKGEMAYYQAFAEKYHELKFTQDSWCIEVDTTKKLETEWGMIWYWPDAKFSDKGWLNYKTNVYNTSIQSLATGEIVPTALVYLWHATRHMDLIICNTVHDSIEAEVPDEELEEYQKIAVECMTKELYNYLERVYNIEYSVDLAVGITIGDYWGELPEGQNEIKVRVETPYNTEVIS